MLRNYATRLTEVEEQIVYIEARDAINKTKWINKLMRRVFDKKVKVK